MPTCQKCHRQFKRQFCLNRHESSHHGTELHQCPKCHNMYARRDNLEKHRRKCSQARRRHTETDTGRTTLPSLERNSLDNTIPSYLEQAPASNNISQPIEEDIQLARSIQPSHEGVMADPSQFSSNEDPQMSLNLEDWSSFQAWTNGYCNIDWTVPRETSRSAVVSYDILGRVNADQWWSPEQNNPPCPPFLDKILQGLRHNFPNAMIDSVMYPCCVHPVTAKPIFRSNNPYLPGNPAFRAQYVPMIQCLDCPTKELFEMSPFDGVQAIKDHLNVPHHWLASLNKTHAASFATTKGSQWPSLQQFEKQFATRANQTLLIVAVKKNGINMLGQLLKDGFQVHEKDDCHRSALHWACCLGRMDMADLLIRYGAKADDHDAYGQTPLDIAFDVGGVGAAANLLRVLARVKQNESPHAFDTPLALGCRFDRLTVIEELINAGDNVNGSTINSPLAIAIRHSSSEVMQFLITKGASLKAITIVDLRDLIKKRDGTFIGSLYPDAAEKICLLKSYGLDVDAQKAVPMQPWRSG